MARLLIGIAAFLLGVVFVSASASHYEDSIRAWQQHRDAGLKKQDSWLTLVGLFWLKPGKNTIGSAENNDFVLPKGSAPEHAGELTLSGNQITYKKPGNAPVPLSYDEDEPTKIQTGRVQFYVIKRGDRYAVRAKDSASPVLKNFKGMTFYPINPGLHFEGKLIPDVKKIPILNILGETEMQESPGVVEFERDGKTYHLRPIYEGKTLFFLFKDPTNKTETYQAGRMLNTPLPVDGKVDLDFNRAYNPPCTFTPYATCPLPPRENTLPFAVTAGEKRYTNGHSENPNHTE